MQSDRSLRTGCGVLLLFVGLVAVTSARAVAITGGERDEVHTNVGLIRFTTEAGRFRCTGTLICTGTVISPTVVLTAGHCAGETGDSAATNVYVSFNTDLPLDPLARGMTPQERAARAANYITGTARPIRTGMGSCRSPSSTAKGSSFSTRRRALSGRASPGPRCCRSARWTPTRARLRTRRSRWSAMASRSVPRRRRSS
jgi:hypothetical protein